jgi:integrase
MLRLRADGKADRTANNYLIAMKSFIAWCVREGRAPADPIKHLSKLNSYEDPKLERRILSAGELAHLVATAAASETTWRRMSGRDRAMIYAMAAGTGLRAKELGSLTLASIDLDGQPPTATIEAAYSKRRRRDEQPLPAWLVDRLRTWLAATRQTSPVTAKLFPGGWPKRAAEMLREDLEAAEIPYLDADGRVFDFHALRHQYISSLAAAGVHPKIAQTLARHSTIDLTMNRYTHLLRTDLAGALATVPGPAPAPDRQRAQATGTHGPEDPCCTNVCATGADKPSQKSPTANMGKMPRNREKRSQAVAGPRLAAVGAGDDDPTGPGRPRDSKSGAPKGVVGSNPMPSAVKT